jgi:hypothetical protein
LGSYNKQNKNTNLFYMNFYYEMKLYTCTCYDVNKSTIQLHIMHQFINACHVM